MTHPDYPYSPSIAVALRALAAAHPHALTAAEVGGRIVQDRRDRGERTVGQRGARYVGPGAIAAPTLRSLSIRGWAAAVPRPDGLSGTAWALTQAGRDALAGIDATHEEVR